MDNVAEARKLLNMPDATRTELIEHMYDTLYGPPKGKLRSPRVYAADWCIQWIGDPETTTVAEYRKQMADAEEMMELSHLLRKWKEGSFLPQVERKMKISEDTLSKIFAIIGMAGVLLLIVVLAKACATMLMI